MRLSLGLTAASAVLAVLRPAWWPWLAGAVGLDQALLVGVGLWPRSQWLGPNLVRLPPASAARLEVALTFDDGPDPAVTPQVLALLAAAGVTASFFCIGVRADAHPDVVQAIVRGGHSVENHSLTHPGHFACLMPASLRRQVDGAQAILTARAGRPPCFFRPPMGFRGPPLDGVLARSGLRHMAWTRRGYDARRRDPARVLRRLLRDLAAGDVLLLHDGNAARTQANQPVVLAVLPALLTALAARGLRAVSLPAAFDGAAGAADAAAAPAPGGDASRSAAHCPAHSENA